MEFTQIDINGVIYEVKDKLAREKLKHTIINGEQTVISEEDGGVNVFTFTDFDGTTKTLEVRNGNKGSKGDTGPQGPKGDTGDVGMKYDEATETLLVSLAR